MNVIDWEAIAAPWLQVEAGLELVHQVVLDGIMQRAGPMAGKRVLDIGCGTGASTLAASKAVGPSGRVTAVDISTPLAERVKARAPENVQVVVGDAAMLRYDQPFDTAISSFGTMFFIDTQAAFSTIRQGLTTGAKFVFAAWGAPPNNPWFRIPRGSVEAQMGALPKPDMEAPGPFRFANADATVEIIQSAGWDVAVETESLALKTGQNADGLADMHLILSEAILLAGQEITDNDREAIRKNLRDGFSTYDAVGLVEVPAEIHFFTAKARG